MCISRWSQTPECASHRGVQLRGVHHTMEVIKISQKGCGVHHTAESNCTPQSQTVHCRVKIKIFVSLWLLLKWQSGEILLEVNTSIRKEKIWRTIFWFAKPKILTPRCHAHLGVNFFLLCDRISQRNWIRIQNTLACLSGAQIGSNHEKNGGRKSRDTLP